MMPELGQRQDHIPQDLAAVRACVPRPPLSGIIDAQCMVFEESGPTMNNVIKMHEGKDHGKVAKQQPVQRRRPPTPN